MKLIAISILSLSLLLPATSAQTSQGKRVQPESSERSAVSASDLTVAQRREFAISAVISLAKEATSFSDLALRPRVLARAADILWDADTVNARALLFRAWEAAEKGDAEEVTIKTKDNPPPMVIGLRRLGGHDLRSEVLGIMARRDRKLAAEFLAKLRTELERQAKESDKTRPLDGWSVPVDEAKRFQVARQLLQEGQVEAALEIASPALQYVNVKSIGFLSELRIKNDKAADQRFSFLLSRAALDPSSDANTVSGLSSYVFTPGLYITFRPGGSTWAQPEEVIAPPNLPATLRDQFFQVAAGILLRRLPPSDQDFSSAGRAGTISVIARLLPLFEQYMPDTAISLRTYLIELKGNVSAPRENDNPLLTQGLRPSDSEDSVEGLQERIDRARTSQARDEIYAHAAVSLAAQGDLRAREFADKIDDSERRSLVRQFVDFQFVKLAIRKNEVSDVLRMAETGQLTSTQRAFAYTEAARLLMSTAENGRRLELLEKATNESTRIENVSVDRAVVLVGIATEMLRSDPARAWEIMNEAAKAANASEEFNGENSIGFWMPTRGSLKTISIGGENFSLFRLFQLLAKEDLYRSIDLTKSFKNDAARATSILGIASAILKDNNLNSSSK